MKIPADLSSLNEQLHRTVVGKATRRFLELIDFSPERVNPFSFSEVQFYHVQLNVFVSSIANKGLS